jgi:DNA polymerase-3 subunit alpha
MASAIAERERRGDFTSLEDFAVVSILESQTEKSSRVWLKPAPLTSSNGDGRSYSPCIEETLAASAASHRDRAAGQVSLFGDLPPAPIARAAHTYTPWTDRETLSFEKELLGFYVTGIRSMLTRRFWRAENIRP